MNKPLSCLYLTTFLEIWLLLDLRTNWKVFAKGWSYGKRSRKRRNEIKMDIELSSFWFVRMMCVRDVLWIVGCHECFIGIILNQYEYCYCYYQYIIYAVSKTLRNILIWLSPLLKTNYWMYKKQEQCYIENWKHPISTLNTT